MNKKDLRKRQTDNPMILNIQNVSGISGCTYGAFREMQTQGESGMTSMKVNSARQLFFSSRTPWDE